MDDAGVRRDDAEVVERLLAPAEEAVALLVALELELARSCASAVLAAELVDLHRVIDDELDGLERVDLASGRRPAASSRRASRRGRRRAGTPVKSWRSTRLGVNAISWLGSAFASHFATASMSSAVDGDAVLGAEEVLEEDLQRERELRRARVLLVDRVEAVDRVGVGADLQRRLAAEGVLGHWAGEYRALFPGVVGQFGVFLELLEGAPGWPRSRASGACSAWRLAGPCDDEGAACDSVHGTRRRVVRAYECTAPCTGFCK